MIKPTSKFGSATFALGKKDVGSTISMEITAARDGYTSIIRTSPGVVVGDAFQSAPVPQIQGEAVVGATLTVDIGSWRPRGVTLNGTAARVGDSFG